MYDLYLCDISLASSGRSRRRRRFDQIIRRQIVLLIQSLIRRNIDITLYRDIDND